MAYNRSKKGYNLDPSFLARGGPKTGLRAPDFGVSRNEIWSPVGSSFFFARKRSIKAPETATTTGAILIKVIRYTRFRYVRPRTGGSCHMSTSVVIEPINSFRLDRSNCADLRNDAAQKQAPLPILINVARVKAMFTQTDARNQTDGTYSHINAPGLQQVRSICAELQSHVHNPFYQPEVLGPTNLLCTCDLMAGKTPHTPKLVK